MCFNIINGKEHLSSEKNSKNIITFPAIYDNTTRTSRNIYPSEAFFELLIFKTAAFLRRKQKVRLAFFMAEVVFRLCGWNIVKSRQVFVRALAVGSWTSCVSAQVDP